MGVLGREVVFHSWLPSRFRILNKWIYMLFLWAFFEFLFIFDYTQGTSQTYELPWSWRQDRHSILLPLVQAHLPGQTLALSHSGLSSTCWTKGGHFAVAVFYGNAEICSNPAPMLRSRFCGDKWRHYRSILMLTRKSCHWGPIIALSIVTSSSTYCLFQLSVLPNVVVFKSVHNVVCYSWIAIILKNFFQVCACYFVRFVCIFSYIQR